MPTASSSTLSLALLVAGYLNALCTTSPNQTSTLYANDRIRFLTNTPAVLGTHISNLTVLYQAIVTLFHTSSASDREILNRICLYPDHLDSNRVTWSPHTVGYLALLGVGAYIRLSAYGGLGRNFTFQLATPDRLVTTGVYKYLQHPSYTGILLVILGHAALVCGRLDTPVACWVPPLLLEKMRKWHVPFGALVALAISSTLGVRIRDEERMLREKFSKEWEAWHAKTSRLIPGVF
ncbi:methyltransferase family protein [Aspergillus lucknowensis]|uniref:Protein-S-isoprenylcysteine O-methyltransferase n=1 Tax=Aspergillus lucknowensis TaxID=176173 RepID=A0ABR4M1G3_9EURO